MSNIERVYTDARHFFEEELGKARSEKKRASLKRCITRCKYEITAARNRRLKQARELET